jgi:lambda repressor-like predicted transcriptional regulator
MSNGTFSQAVVAGLESRGVSRAEIRRFAGISSSTFDLILSGKSDFSDRAIAKIEDSAGMTGGQLAALALEPRGGPLTRLMEGWAEVHDEATSGKSTPKHM